MATLERDSKGKLQFVLVSQLDFKLRVPQFMITSFLPSALKGWHTALSKFVVNKKNFH